MTGKRASLNKIFIFLIKRHTINPQQGKRYKIGEPHLSLAPSLDGRTNEHNAKIVNGVPTTIENHPYQVQVLNSLNGEMYICGGSTLNENTILTAAHCMHGPEHFVGMIVGSSYLHKGGIFKKVTSVFLHEDYKLIDVNGESYAHNDIAILKLQQDLIFSGTVQPISLQPVDSPVPAGTLATVTGWGRKNENDPKFLPPILQEAKLIIVSNEECNKIYCGLSFEITDDILCAYAHGKGSCYGDSGGLLVVGNKLIGVASSVVACAHPNYPGIYANVSHLHDFITKHL